MPGQKPGPIHVTPESIHPGKLVGLGQRELDLARVAVLYKKFAKNPYVILTTPGMVILDPYDHPEGMTLLSELKPNKKDLATFNKMLHDAIKLPHGGQHGVKAQCLAIERKHRVAMAAINDRGGISTNLFDLSGLEAREKNKITSWLVSEHGDVQELSKGMTFMENMKSARTYIQKFLECQTVAELREYLSTLDEDKCEAEKQMLMEKLNKSSIEKTAVNTWTNTASFLRFALQAVELWDNWCTIEKMVKNFQCKGQDKHKARILASYKRKNKRGRSSLTSKTKKKNKGAGKSKRVIRGRMTLTKLVGANTTSRVYRTDEIRMEDTPALSQTHCFNSCVVGGEDLLLEVQAMVINGQLALGDMVQMRKSLGNLALVQQDMTDVADDACWELQNEGEDKWDTLMRLGVFSQEDFRGCVLNLPAKQNQPMTDAQRRKYATQPVRLKGMIKAKFAPNIAAWLRTANLRAQFLLKKQRGQEGEEEKSRADELKNEHNTVFEFQLPIQEMGQLKAHDDDDMKRHLVLIQADNTDQKSVIDAMPQGVKFDMMKGSMDYGMRQYPGDAEHTSADDLKKLFEWFGIYNEDHPCSVFLGCMPEKIGMVMDALEPYCNAGTVAGAWYKPYKFNKNPVVGLDCDLEHRVIGWHTQDGKLLGSFFGEKDQRSRVTSFPAILQKLRDKINDQVFNASEENPLVRTSHEG